MKAITLWPEWSAAVAWLDKGCENRTWWPPRELEGQRIAIHAGKHIGGRPGRPAMAEGLEGLIGTARLAGWAVVGWSGLRTDPKLWCVTDPGWTFGEATPQDCDYQDLAAPQVARARGLVEVPVHRGAIVATAVLARAERAYRTAWDVGGAVHWRLADVRRLATPVPCKGFQNLWTVPDDVLAEINRQEAA
jgi:hypothetical protein